MSPFKACVITYGPVITMTSSSYVLLFSCVLYVLLSKFHILPVARTIILWFCADFVYRKILILNYLFCIWGILLPYGIMKSGFFHSYWGMIKLLHSDVVISLPTFIIAECVLIYLDPDSTRGIVGWAARTFSTAIFFLYEQVLHLSNLRIFGSLCLLIVLLSWCSCLLSVASFWSCIVMRLLQIL